MIVNARVGYEFSYIRKGGRKVRRAVVHDRVPVVVADIPEVPVRISLPGDKRWREHEGSLYHQLRRRDFEDGTTPFDSEIQHIADTERIEGNPLDSLPIREIVSDGREEAARRAQETADRFRATPTAMLVRSEGPYCHAVPRYGIGGHTIEVRDAFWHSYYPWTAVSPKDLPRMVDYMGFTAARLAEMDIPAVPDLPESLMPASIRELVVADLAEQVLLNTVRGLPVATYPLSFLRAHLRYTAPGFDRSAANPDLPGLLEQASIAVRDELPEVSFDLNGHRAPLAIAASAAVKALELNGYRSRPRPAFAFHEDDTPASPGP